MRRNKSDSANGETETMPMEMFEEDRVYSKTRVGNLCFSFLNTSPGDPLRGLKIILLPIRLFDLMKSLKII